MHNIGICHRDINPNNILLDDNFNPKIYDFGFSTPIKVEDGSEKLYGTLGTSIYKLPQMYIKNTPYNGSKADIFSLWVTLFSLLTKKSCFLAASKNDKYYRCLIDNPKGYENYFQKIVTNDSDSFFKFFF